MHHFIELENRLEFTSVEQTAGPTLTERSYSIILIVQF